jgi:acetyltransferase-like isoleucine patch superfamily enzyme
MSGARPILQRALFRVASGGIDGVAGQVAYKIHQRLSWSFDLARAQARAIGVQVADDANLYGEISYGSEPWLIRIGPLTEVTNGVSFITHDGATRVVRLGPHGPSDAARVNRYGPITIGRNCFIGTRAIVLPGVRIGDDCIVGAGAVVTRDVDGGQVVAGNPARVVSSLEEYARKAEAEALDLPGSWPDAETWRRVVEQRVWEAWGPRNGGR